MWSYLLSALLGALGGTLSGYVLARRQERRACGGAKHLIADELRTNAKALRALIEDSGRLLEMSREPTTENWDAVKCVIVACVDRETRCALVDVYSELAAFQNEPVASFPRKNRSAVAQDLMGSLESAYKALTGNELP